MKGLIRGVAGAAVVLGATACADDYSIDFGGAPTAVQASPEVMFVTSGANKEVLVRLVNDRNQSVPAEYTVSNVGAGITVTYDATYRPQWTPLDPNLEPPAVKEQQRYIVAANIPTGGKREFTLSSGGLSQTATVFVMPTTVGAAMSSLNPALGDPVTITAPEGQSFSANSAVSFPTGGAPIIVSQSADAITFIPRPGTAGPATVSNIVLDYAPTLAGRSLATIDSLTVPAVTAVTGNFSTNAPANGTTFTFTTTGFRFTPATNVSFAGVPGIVTAISADSTQLTIIAPPGVAGVPMTINGALLSFLLTVPLGNVPTVGTITTAAAFSPPSLAGTSDPTAGSPTISVVEAGGGGLFDSGAYVGADIIGGGGPIKWYRVIVAGATRTRPVWVNWEGSDADLDFYMTNAAVSAFVGSTAASAGANQPETQAISLAAGTYFIANVNWGNQGTPAWTMVIVQ